ncbi:hypothetical protein FG061_00010 [Vibrio cholerae]|nr:hypothetical protein [Vibrio cholerae]EGR2015953.1 hypothetical protein [Vibrio cholerae]EGR2444093.1 hypothetical protein [Vibrio cholerae]EGR4423813.1 hypothetical protein [Vibrio cholerae]MBG8954711.1 hypothetical protein [Vibrio cholerae]
MIKASSKTEQLAALVAQAGGARKAEELIKSVRGAAPSKSAIDRAIKGGGTDYNVQCMIDDLTVANSRLLT